MVNMNSVPEFYKAVIKWLEAPVIDVRLSNAEELEECYLQIDTATEVIQSLNERILELEYRYASECTQNMRLQDILNNNGIEWRKP